MAFDAKTLGRPRTFNGYESSWNAWAFSFRAYVALVSSELNEMMVQTEHDDRPTTLSADDAMLRLQHQLYYLLAVVCEGKAASLIQLVERLLRYHTNLEEKDEILCSR